MDCLLPNDSAGVSHQPGIPDVDIGAEASDYDPDDDEDASSAQMDEMADMEEFAEPVLRYFSPEDGGYPIQIGEILVNTYQVLHKIGHGGFSTVWMAEHILEKRTVALKILESGEAGEREYLIQGEIINTVQDVRRLVLYQSSFQLMGNAGKLHRVFVFPMRGPDLRVCLAERPMSARMSAGRQLLVALKGLHDAGIVHRDLNTGAVMWGMIPLDGCDTATKYRYFGEPYKVSLATYVGRPYRAKTFKPGELVKPLQVPQNLLTETVYLGDFGMAIKAGTEVNFKPQSPAEFCAPERFHNFNPSFASDIWSYMTILVTLYTGAAPFCGGWGERTMSGWFDALGPMPKHWEGRYNVTRGITKDEWYDQSKAAKPENILAVTIARKRPDINEVELDLALKVFSKVFCYEPQSRFTAGQLLEDQDFNSLLAIYGA